jgi:hypothetical protein
VTPGVEPALDHVAIEEQLPGLEPDRMLAGLLTAVGRGQRTVRSKETGFY